MTMMTTRAHRLTPNNFLIPESEVKLALGIKNPDPLVKEERIEKCFYQLQQINTYPNGTQFAAYIQDPSDEEPKRLAVFMIRSEHPKNPLKSVITFNPIEYDTWVEIEKSYRHYAGLSDPIRPIFAGTLRRHMEQITNLKELQ